MLFYLIPKTFLLLAWVEKCHSWVCTAFLARFMPKCSMLLSHYLGWHIDSSSVLRIWYISKTSTMHHLPRSFTLYAHTTPFLTFKFLFFITLSSKTICIKLYNQVRCRQWFHIKCRLPNSEALQADHFKLIVFGITFVRLVALAHEKTQRIYKQILLVRLIHSVMQDAWKVIPVNFYWNAVSASTS